MERPPRSGGVAPSSSGGYQRSSLYASPSTSKPSGNQLDDRTRKSTSKYSKRRKRRGHKSHSSLWKLLCSKNPNYLFIIGIAFLCPILIMAVFVMMYLQRIETPRPALVLSPEQVQEIHHAQELHHLHLLQEAQIQQEEQLEKRHDEKHQHHHVQQIKEDVIGLEQNPNNLLRGGGQKDVAMKAHQNENHVHAIPNVLVFTHSMNLLNRSMHELQDSEDKVLKKNLLNTIKLHNSTENPPTIRFLTNDDCVASIQNVMGHDSPLVQYFQEEPEGMYKGDMCRGAALYETGGLYFDADIHARMNLWNAIQPTTTFVVPRVHVASKNRGSYFQAFIGATPQHAIFKRYLQLFVEYYQGKLPQVRNKPLGVVLLKMAHDDIKQDDSTVELWQEVLYKREWFPNVPPPHGGTRRACHFVVVATPFHKKFAPPFVVPFYSRVQGSRMCGGKDSNVQERNKTHKKKHK